MKRRTMCWMVAILILFTTGCSDRLNVEEVTFSLLIGIDLDEEDHFVFSLSSPVFSKEAKDKEEEFQVRTTTLRKSREEFDRSVVGSTVGSKAQVILLGKRVLEHKDWFKLLDPFYRDVKNTIQATVVLVDGPVADVINFAPPDKPRLPTYLSTMLRTANRRNITAATTLQDLHRQMFEKGMTPNIPEIKKDGNLKIVGTALLKEDGRYLVSLDPDENKLLSILSHHPKGEFPLTSGLLPKRTTAFSILTNLVLMPGTFPRKPRYGTWRTSCKSMSA